MHSASNRADVLPPLPADFTSQSIAHARKSKWKASIHQLMMLAIPRVDRDSLLLSAAIWSNMGATCWAKNSSISSASRRPALPEMISKPTDTGTTHCCTHAVVIIILLGDLSQDELSVLDKIIFQGCYQSELINVEYDCVHHKLYMFT